MVRSRTAMAAGMVWVLLLLLAGNVPAQAQQTLVVWSFGLHGSANDYVVNDLVPRFEQENPGVKVEFDTATVASLQRRERLVATFATGNAPDIWFDGTNILPFYIQLDMLMPLNRFFDASPFTGELVNAELSNYDGNQYALPLYLNAAPVAYRASFFEAAGLDATKSPETWNDMREAARRLLRVENDVIVQRGLQLVGDGSLFRVFNVFLQQNGGSILNPELNEVTMNSPEGLEALEFLVEIQNLAQPHMYGTSAANNFHNGNMAVAYIDPNVGRRIFEADVDWLDDVRMGLPVMKGGDKTKRVAFGGGNSVVISANTPNPDLAWKFIEFMYRPDNALQIALIAQAPLAVRSVMQSPDLPDLIREAAAAQFFLQDVKGSEAVPEYPVANAEIVPLFREVMDGRLAPSAALEMAAQAWHVRLQERLAQSR